MAVRSISRVSLLAEHEAVSAELADVMAARTSLAGGAGADELARRVQDLEAQMRTIRGKRISMIMQDPKYSLNPVVRVGDQIAEAWLTHHPGHKTEAKAKARFIQHDRRDDGQVRQERQHGHA